MQLYNGLPIITNKITPDEQCDVPHHLLGCIGLEERPWTVSKFVASVLSIIADIHSRGRLPILVGGTHYYTQSVLFDDALAPPPEPNEESIPQDDGEDTGSFPILQESTSAILAKLQEVDPMMARRWHPNDHRKISRSLQIYLQTGRRASDVYAEQKRQRQNKADEASGEAGMRFDTLLLWPHPTREVLNERLDRRVDRMVERGLLDEVREMRAYADAHPDLDFSSGIWVSIGYKEWLPVTQLSPGTEDGSASQSYVESEATARQLTQIATRQYARRQTQWIRVRLLRALKEAGAAERLYILDGDDVDHFDETVVGPAQDLADKFLRDEALPDHRTVGGKAKGMLADALDTLSASDWTPQECETCNVVRRTESEWKSHLASRSHKNAVTKARRGHDEEPPWKSRGSARGLDDSRAAVSISDDDND